MGKEWRRRGESEGDDEHSAHISQATWVSGVIPSKIVGRSGVSQSQMIFCLLSGQCLLPRTIPERTMRVSHTRDVVGGKIEGRLTSE